MLERFYGPVGSVNFLLDLTLGALFLCSVPSLTLEIHACQTSVYISGVDESIFLEPRHKTCFLPRIHN